METGKLPKDILLRLLSGVAADSGVIIGPEYGEDAAAVAVTREVMVAASDPITFATHEIGWYAVTVNANDIAVTGAVPRYFLATILLPVDSSQEEAEIVFEQISSTCQALGVTLIGGHTEITDAVNRTVVSGVMLGETDRDSLISTAGALPGDDVVLIGSIAVEGTALLAIEADDDLAEHSIPAEQIERAKGFLKDPGISVLGYAIAAASLKGVHSMHDPTEGGIASAICEVAHASRCGISIQKNSIPVLPECRLFCEALGIDPLGLIASGCVLLTCDPSVTAQLLETSATVIGKVTEGTGVSYSDGSLFPVFARDEIARYFAAKGM